MMICPNPFFEKAMPVDASLANEIDDIVYCMSDLMLVVMFFRLFFLYRTIINFSEYTDAFSLKVCKQYGFNSGAFFAIKVKLITNPGVLVFVDFMAQVFVLSYVMRIFERPHLGKD